MTRALRARLPIIAFVVGITTTVSSMHAQCPLGAVATPGFPQDIAIQGNIAYVSDGSAGGLQVIDISDSANPTIIGSVGTPSPARGIAVATSAGSDPTPRATPSAF